MILSAIYGFFLVGIAWKNPYLLLNMSYSGIVAQYKHLSIIVASVYHFGVSDLLTTLLIRQLTLILNIPFYFCILMAIFLFLWCPVGVFISEIILGCYYISS